MVKHNKTVAVAVAAVLASAAMRANQAEAQNAPATATGTDNIEEVVVTGIRASLKASMDVKRDAIGIVDAITAEDIGKFPDSNLSESLQRITGVSISRRNGEGALVTARGFGSEFNMVTLNGRMMPSADAFAGGNSIDGGVPSSTRSFNFANLASESISAVQVYKTGRSDIATGGIGATVNILTARPFDNNGMIANVGVKAVKDTTNRTGSDITPEVSGIFSYANDAKTWGVGLTGSYQKRDSGASMSTINDWNIRTWHTDLEAVDQSTKLSRDAGGVINAAIVNAPADGQLYGIPNDIRYHFSDRERKRTNAQLTFQFRPMDTLTLTADYTYAENNLVEDRGDQTTWMNANHFNRLEFDTGQAVATPLVLEEDEGTAKDFGFEQQHREQTSKLKSAGFNAGWKVNDSFSLNFDIHDSKADSLPDDPVTGGGETAMSFAARVPSACTPVGSNNCTNRSVQAFMFNNGLAISNRTFFSQATTSAPATGGDPDLAFTPADLGSQVLRINYEAQTTDITQARLDGALQFDNGRFQFGVETRSMESHQKRSNGQMTLGDWGVASPGEIPADLLQPFSLTGQFRDFTTNGTPTTGWKGNANALGQWAVGQYGTWRDATQTNGVLEFNPGFSDDHTVKEDTQAAYIEFGLKSNLGSLPTNILLGVRYEHTEVEAVSSVIIPTGLVWQDNNDFSVVRGTTFTPFAEKKSYDNVLPSLDFDIQLRDGLKGRVSYSKTIARAAYDQLRSAVDVRGTQGSTLNGFSPSAFGSNPALVPLESDNLDLSLEWYFGESSYASVGLFEKRVSNFIGNEVSKESLFDIRDQTAGPRALAAVAALEAGNANSGGAPYTADDTNLFTMMAMMENSAATGGAAAFDGTEAQHLAIATQYDILPNSTDPLYQFNVSRPVNNKEAKLHGAEIAGQHFFGTSGFGIQANYTIVRGDVGFNNAGDPSVNQFALLGLSDSANVVAMYEKYGITVRLAYNWRDQYLATANQGNFRNPVYVEAYDQIDLDIGYKVNDHLALAFEGLNLTQNDVRWHGRSTAQVWFLEDQGARYSLGARYKF